VVDNAQSGRPSNAVTNVNTEKAEQMLKEDRTLSLREMIGC
jgi:hypothetical protein